MNRRLLLAVFLLLITALGLRAERIAMKQAGANFQGDNAKLNTSLIHEKVKHLSELGGGTLFFPAGIYLTGPIELKSNLTIELAAGAILKFSDAFDLFLRYALVRHEGVRMNSFNPLSFPRNA